VLQDAQLHLRAQRRRGSEAGAGDDVFLGTAATQSVKDAEGANRASELANGGAVARNALGEGGTTEVVPFHEAVFVDNGDAVRYAFHEALFVDRNGAMSCR
jgi:hypothetical protein